MAGKSLIHSPAGDLSSKRFLAFACFAVAIGIAVLDIVKGGTPNAVELVKAFLWPATVILVGGTAAEQLGGLKIGGAK